MKITGLLTIIWDFSSTSPSASRNHFFFFLSLDFHELWRSVRSICLFTKWQWATLVLGWVSISSIPAMASVCVGISSCHQTFINSSALLVSLMAVQLAYVDRNTFRPFLYLEANFTKGGSNISFHELGSNPKPEKWERSDLIQNLINHATNQAVLKLNGWTLEKIF